MGLDVDFFHFNAENLPFEDGYFDVVVNRYLLWTLSQPDLAFLEWKRVLKPGDRFLQLTGTGLIRALINASNVLFQNS
ncbi:class I SAM-dependent methyltransferase [Methanosarcina sp. Mfa9]|uniref:class I SAM-dependent methyltransferase n=1 Tax=Methanosarcina sp. Mfa9 TaxID=3439063 RepID=UPI003F87886D